MHAAVTSTIAAITILHHNVYEGRPSFVGDVSLSRSQNVRSYFHWVSEQIDADVVTLNELNGWAGAGAVEIARSFGYTLDILSTNRGYDIGVASRLPMMRVEPSSTASGFHHGLLHVFVATTAELSSTASAPGDRSGIHVLVTHLSPHSSEFRRQETQQICSLVRELDSSHVVLAGDLNTLARSNSVDNERLTETIRLDRRLSRKFLIGGAVDYVPMDNLVSCLEDMAITSTGTATSHVSSPAEAGGGWFVGSPTVPTSILEDSMHFAPMRLDYILASPHLAKMWRDSGRHVAPVVNPTTSQMSDHYPLLLSSHSQQNAGVVSDDGYRGSQVTHANKSPRGTPVLASRPREARGDAEL